MLVEGLFAQDLHLARDSPQVRYMDFGNRYVFPAQLGSDALTVACISPLV